MGDQDYVAKINHFPSFHLESDSALWLFAGHSTRVRRYFFSRFEENILNLGDVFIVFAIITIDLCLKNPR